MPSIGPGIGSLIFEIKIMAACKVLTQCMYFFVMQDDTTAPLFYCPGGYSDPHFHIRCPMETGNGGDIRSTDSALAGFPKL